MIPPDLDAQLAQLVTDVLVPLRAEKRLDRAALERLHDLVGRIGDSGDFAESIPTALAGRLWFIHYSMLDGAHHAQDPWPIQRAAAAYAEVLRTRVFGPIF